MGVVGQCLDLATLLPKKQMQYPLYRSLRGSTGQSGWVQIIILPQFDTMCKIKNNRIGIFYAHYPYEEHPSSYTKYKENTEEFFLIWI
jgi:hypothetical protein